MFRNEDAMGLADERAGVDGVTSRHVVYELVVDERGVLM
jgi:hypothetical protein